jgi:hypothetical protein
MVKDSTNINKSNNYISLHVWNFYNSILFTIYIYDIEEFLYLCAFGACTNQRSSSSSQQVFCHAVNTRLAAASDKIYQLLAHGRWFSPGTPASSTSKTGRHDIAEILLKVALNTMNQLIKSICHDAVIEKLNC